MTIVYTNTFLAPLLLLIGPSDTPSAMEAALAECTRKVCDKVGAALGLTLGRRVGPRTAMPRIGRASVARAFRHRQFGDDGPSSETVPPM